ncbi:MAG: hypothetical protein K940chlam9_00493 [Chlamydiae bacterium]|nr:hypothetical protein [Chlamydiota bacterium]
MGSYATSFLNDLKLPLVVETKNVKNFAETIECIQAEKRELRESILKYGGILLRGFPIEGADEFNEVIDALGLGRPIQYIGGDTPRDRVKGEVYTSTEAPPSLMIPLHNEMSFIKHYPRHIYFHCVTPSETGGETAIGDARAIYQTVAPSVRDRFAEKRLSYISNFYKKNLVLDTINKYCRAHKTWMDAFQTDDKEEVERRCLANEFKFAWRPKDWLRVTYEMPAVIDHPETGEKVWFNQAHLYDYNRRLLGFWNWVGAKFVYAKKERVMHEIYFGDGTKVPKEDLYHVMDVLEKKTIKFPWQKGDVMVLDNVLTMHGRASFTGKRKILASLTR